MKAENLVFGCQQLSGSAHFFELISASMSKADSDRTCDAETPLSMAAGCQPHRIFQRDWRHPTTHSQSRAQVFGSTPVACCQVMSGSDHFLKRLCVIRALSWPCCSPGLEIPMADCQQLSPSHRFSRGNCHFEVLTRIGADASRLCPFARPTKTCQGWSGSTHFFDMFSGWNGSPMAPIAVSQADRSSWRLIGPRPAPQRAALNKDASIPDRHGSRISANRKVRKQGIGVGSGQTRTLTLPISDASQPLQKSPPSASESAGL